MTTLLRKLESIEELNCVLENWSQDDKRPKSDYATEELIELAEWRLREFAEDGHMLNDMLLGLDGPEEKRYAMSQRRKIQTWLKQAKQS